jgi:hypothetical protein
MKLREAVCLDLNAAAFASVVAGLNREEDYDGSSNPAPPPDRFRKSLSPLGQ